MLEYFLVFMILHNNNEKLTKIDNLYQYIHFIHTFLQLN